MRGRIVHQGVAFRHILVGVTPAEPLPSPPLKLAPGLDYVNCEASTSLWCLMEAQHRRILLFNAHVEDCAASVATDETEVSVQHARQDREALLRSERRPEARHQR